MANRRFIDFPIASTVGDSDIILIWQSGANKQTTKATFLSGLPENLDELNDVAISGLTNGQILRYDSVTGKWENTDQGNLDLNDLNDVSIVSPSNGQVLVYNSSTSQWENSSGGYVPYVGAVTTVDLGAQGLRAGYVRFDTTVAGVPNEQGLMFWDADDETVDIILNGYTMKIGEDLFYPVKNQTGSTIAKGVAVRFNGTVGASGRLLIAPFIADGSVPSSRFMGVTAEEILNGEDGKVLYFGRVRGINTNAFNEGDILYASTTVAGGYQTAIPVAPNNIVQVAAVVTKSATVGTIFVRPTLGSNINTDEGVKITSVADKNLLQYQSGTSLWENKSLAQVLGGTSAQFVKGDGSLDSTSYGTGTVTSVGLSSATSGVTIGSSPVTTSGTITLAIATASGSQNGLLSSTDWTTFNGKQNALTNPVTGTGTTNYLPKFTGSTTIGNSNVQDSGSLVTINSETKFQVGANATRNVYFGTSATNYGRITYNDATGELAIGTIENYSTLFISNNTTKMTLFSSGNLLVGTGSDNGAKLQVSGEININSGATRGLRIDTNNGVQGISLSPNSIFGVDEPGIGNGRFIINTSGNVGIANNSPSFRLDVSGTGRYLQNNSSLGNATGITLQQSGSGDIAISYQLTGVREWLVGIDNSDSDTFKINNITGSSDFNNVGLAIATTGAATFSSSVTANNYVASGGSNTTVFNSASATTGWVQIAMNNTSGSALLGIEGTTAGTLATGSIAYASVLRNYTNTAFQIATNNIVRATITSGGNVGIGTTSPTSGRLEIQQTTTTAALWVQTGGTSASHVIADFRTGTNLPALQILGNGFSYFGGNVGINSTGVSTQGEIFFVTATNLAAMFRTTGGAANNWAANFWNNATSGNNLFIEFGTETSYNGRGSVTYNRGSGVVAYNTTSDYRIKTEIQDFNAFNIINNLKPKEFKIGDAKQKSIGFIAHELQEFFPQAVHGEKDAIDSNNKPIYQGVDYSQLTGLLVKAIQELKQEIDNLKN